MPHETPPQPNTEQQPAIPIAKMTAEELTDYRDSHPDAIKTEEFASQLSWKQLDDLDSMPESSRWSEEDRDAIKLNKGLRPRRSMNSLAPEAYSRLERMDIDKLAVMFLGNPEWFFDPVFVSALKWGQVDAILKDSRWTTENKQEIRRLKDTIFDDASRCAVGLEFGQEELEPDLEKRKAIRAKIDKLKDRLTWEDKDARIPRPWVERKQDGSYAQDSVQAEYIKYLKEQGKTADQIEQEMQKAEYLHKQSEKMMWAAAENRSHGELAKSRGMYWRNPWVFRVFGSATMKALREKDRGELMPVIRTILGWYYAAQNAKDDPSVLTDANIDALLYLVTDREGKTIYSPGPNDLPLPEDTELRELKKQRQELARKEADAKRVEILKRLGLAPNTQ